MRRHFAILAVAALAAFAPGSSEAVQTYKVKKGDTLSRIARSLHVSVDELREANDLQSNLLRPGTKLKVPSVSKKSARQTQPVEAQAASPSEDVQGAARAEADREEESEGSRNRRVHVVKRGDTLYAISRAFDVPVKDLQRLNGIGAREKLKPGTSLVVKPGEKPVRTASARRAARKTYVVKNGDTVWQIAKKFHLAAADLKRMNGLRSDSLKVGQKLVVQERISTDNEDSEETVADCRLDEKQIASELKELNERAEAEGEEADVTDRLMRVAKKMLGIRYKFGGSSFQGIDCSAYVQKVFRFLNVPLPRTAREQYAVGKSVDKDELATGDLVFFRTYARYPSHVGIYLGDSKFIHASSVGKKVTIDSLDEPFYIKRYIGAKRLVEEESEEALPAKGGEEKSG